MRARSHKKNHIKVVTLGCSKNLYDSEVLMGQLAASGKKVSHENDPEEGNIVVINTCGFIEKAKEESVNTILDFVQRKEEGLVDQVFVMGCLSERYKPDLEKEIPDVDQYFGTRDLPRLLKTLGADYKRELVGERLLTTPSHYAYLKVSEGCDRKCSFCAIPLMRGGHRSIPIEDLVKEAESLASKGVHELMLIAQDLTYYGLDLYRERRLRDLLRALSEVEGIEWIRLHYAFPAGFPEDVLEEIRKNPKICDYLDIPLQHISDDLLKSMRRGTTKERTNRLLRKFKEEVPGLAVRTSLIVGYPGETEAHFEELCEWVRETRFDRLGVFTYSHEENTHAFGLEDNIPEDVKEARAARLMEIQEEISYEMNQKKVGLRMRVLIDRMEGDTFIGRTQYDSPDVDNEVIINVPEDQHLRLGSFVEVEIVGAEAFDLFAQLIA
jgi:ribosomal protein S12 methylthiotransferase